MWLDVLVCVVRVNVTSNFRQISRSPKQHSVEANNTHQNVQHALKAREAQGGDVGEK